MCKIYNACFSDCFNTTWYDNMTLNHSCCNSKHVIQIAISVACLIAHYKESHFDKAK